ncbi:CheY-like superfamily [Aspergillus aurantiobrunneus]
MHVLFVDDSQVWQKIAIQSLPELGCTVVIAGDGQAALNYLTGPPATCPRPDIIMMDIAMPVLDGPDTTQIIRTQAPFITDPKICSTPIVGMCVTSLHADHKRFIARGMDDVLVKPWKRHDIQRLLHWWSQRQLIPKTVGSPFPRAAIAPVWGAHPWRAYRGPRSRM